MRGLALVSPRDINDESFHLITGLNIFGQQRHHVEKKTKRCVKSCESVSVVTINDRERKWRCEIQFENISSTR